MKKKRIQLISLTAASFIAGIFMTIAIRSHITPSNQVDPRNEELIRSITSLESEIATLEEQRRLLNERIKSIHEEQAEGESQLSLLNQDLAMLRQTAALTELQGPGIIITIDDNKEGADKARTSSPETFLPENYIVHDKDLLYIVRAVAPVSEAVAINHVRLTGNSHIRCVGTVILVNYAILAPPYEIRLLGDPDTLTQALMASSRYKSLLNKMIPVKITTAEFTLPSYSGGYQQNFSKLVKETSQTVTP